MTKNQKGFGILEVFLIVVVVGVVGFVGWYVLHTKKNADKLLVSSASSNASAPKSTVKLVPITSEAQLESANVSPNYNQYPSPPTTMVAPKVYVFVGAPQSLVEWAKLHGTKYVAGDSPADATFEIDYVSKNGNFAHAGAAANIFLMKKAAGWSVIPGGPGAQSVPDCSVIVRYHIPKDIFAVCLNDKKVTTGDNDWAGFDQNETT